MLFACCWAAAAGRSLTLPTLIMGPIPSVAAGIPADVLARRPDVRAAELRLRKTLARGDEIRTGFYPTLSLTGGASTTSDTRPRCCKIQSAPWAPRWRSFLEYNKTRLSIASADIDYQIAETEFRKQLYTALLEVEDGLAARQQGDQRLRYLEQQRAMPGRPRGWQAPVSWPEPPGATLAG
jgi:outer membrane protein TolC